MVFKYSSKIGAFHESSLELPRHSICKDMCIKLGKEYTGFCKLLFCKFTVGRNVLVIRLKAL